MTRWLSETLCWVMLGHRYTLALIDVGGRMMPGQRCCCCGKVKVAG